MATEEDFQLRDSGGRFASARDVSTDYFTESGENRGAQTWIGGRFHSTGVELNMKTLEWVLSDPHLKRMVESITEDMLQDAQAMAVLNEALYGMIVYNNRPELGPVGVVFCDNYPSVIDDGMNGTLHKVLAKYDHA